MAEEKINLTPQELEEIKDEIKFRTKVMLALKALNGIPKKVVILETQQKTQWWLLALVVTGIVSLAFKVLAK
jgi:hypothetical protein